MLTAVRLWGMQLQLCIFRDCATTWGSNARLFCGTVMRCRGVPKAEEPCSDVPLHQDRDLILAAVETCPDCTLPRRPFPAGRQGGGARCDAQQRAVVSTLHFAVHPHT